MAVTATLQSIAGRSSSLRRVDEEDAARVVLEKFGARAVTLLTGDRAGDSFGGRITSNDAYAVLHEACAKMGRVAARRYDETGDTLPFSQSVATLFPDPAAYLARAIKSVLLDEARHDRREPNAVSLDQPIGDAEASMSLVDLIREDREWKLPESATMEKAERGEFRAALRQALSTVPENYLAALTRDMQRERIRQQGGRVEPDTDRERQMLCRARAAVAKALKSRCSDENALLRLLDRRPTSNPLRTAKSEPWSDARSVALRSRLMQGWAARSRHLMDDAVEEAVVNYIQSPASTDAPSPEMRRSVRVLDLYKMEFRTPQNAEAADLYQRALDARHAGSIEEAIRLYRACHNLEPQFVEALSEVGVLQSQLGNLRDALRVYLGIIEKFPNSDHCLRAATNSADIYMTWFDAGRNRERNIELAIRYARMAMQRPTPMRACNLITALAKDRYYSEAKDVLSQVVREDAPNCSAEKVLNTLFQIRDEDLVRWYTWLERELNGEYPA